MFSESVIIPSKENSSAYASPQYDEDIESGFTAKVDSKMKIKKYFGRAWIFLILILIFSVYANAKPANGTISNNPKLFSDNKVVSNLFCAVIVSDTINSSFGTNCFKLENKDIS